MITITAEQARDITFEDSEEFEVVDSGTFEDDGKYQLKEVIFQPKGSDKYYSLEVCRSGSYFSDYYYTWEDAEEFECPEVKQVVVSTGVWRPVS